MSTATKRTPRSRRTAATKLSYRQAQDARRAARFARQQRAAAMGRVLPKERNPTDGMKTVTTGLVRRAAHYIDADPDLVPWLTERIDAHKKKAGRPRALTVRTALICYVVQAITHKSLNLSDTAAMTEGMTWRVRRQLGINYDRHGRATTVTYDQLLAMFHRIAATFDAWDETLVGHDDEDAIRSERADALQHFIDRLIAATTRGAPMWRGNAAVDATLKWSWERPPSTPLNGKIPRRGVDGDDGRPLSTTEVIGEDGDIDPDSFQSIGATDVTGRALAGRRKRNRSWPSTWGLGAEWIGNKNKAKAVHGYALHTVVRSDSDSPNLIESFTVTPAAGNPAAAVVPLLSRLHQARLSDPAVLEAVEAGEAALLGDIVADPAYTAASITAWQLPLKALGACPIGRLHRRNQDGVRFAKVGKGKRAGQVATISGRPVCECVAHTPLAELRFPKFPYNRRMLDDYQVEIVKLADFEWEPNGARRADGQRQYLSPHGGAVTTPTKVARSRGAGVGGCELCVEADGSAVVGEDGRARQRCCTARSRLLPEEVTALDMGMIHGSPDWYERWNPRNRVEGSYGVIKNLAVVNWGRNYHHFVGLARETVATAFAMVAYNDHMLRSWQAKADLADQLEAGGPLVPTKMTETRPNSTAVNDRRLVAGSRKAKKPRRGPKGMPDLGRPEPPPFGLPEPD